MNKKKRAAVAAEIAANAKLVNDVLSMFAASTHKQKKNVLPRKRKHKGKHEE